MAVIPLMEHLLGWKTTQGLKTQPEIKSDSDPPLGILLSPR